MTNYVLSGKNMMIRLIARQIKKASLYKMSYSPEPDSYGKKIRVEFYLPYFSTKSDLKGATGIDTLDFVKKADLANLKSDHDKLNIKT